MRVSRAALLGLLLPFVLGARPGFAAPPLATPFSLAVLPLEELRPGTSRDWMGLYLQDLMVRAFQRTTRTPTQDGETSRLWFAKLGLSASSPPDPSHLKSMGVDVVIFGTLRTVLQLSELQVQALGPRGSLLPEGGLKLRVHRGEDTPSQAAEALLRPLFQALVPGLVPAPPSQPHSWAVVEQLYGELAQPLRAGDAGAVSARIKALEALADTPGVSARTREALAVLMLEQAQIRTPPGPERHALLRQALAHVDASLQAEPLDSARGALKAEIHYFLDALYMAKTEASVTRIKNPMNGLALVVLAGTAGLSTGEASVNLKKALTLDPFLKASNRPPGTPPFQGGVLEPLLTQWETLRLRAPGGERGEYQDALSRGKALFEAGDYEEADQVLQEAQSQESGDPSALLYRYRILLETRRVDEAVPLLRELAQQYPDHSEVQFQLAQSIELSGKAEDALKEYAKVLKLDARHANARPHMALTLMGLERWAEARDVLRPHLRLWPKDGLSWTALGIIELRLQSWDEAQAALEEALRLNPNSTEARQGLAQLKEQRPQ